MLVPLMSRWVMPRSSEYCSPCASPSDQRQGRLLGEPDADLQEVAQVGALDVLHDHEVPLVLLAVIEHLDDVGMMELQPGLGLLAEAIDRAGVHEEALAEDLDGHRLAGGDPHAAIDPREGPLGEVEEDLAAAVEEAAQVALAELVDLPAGHAPLAEQRVRQGVERPVLRGGHRLVGLVLRGQAEQDHLLGQGSGVDFGHDDGLQARSGRGKDRTLSSGRRDRMCGEFPFYQLRPPSQPDGRRVESASPWNISRFEHVLGQEPHRSLLIAIFDELIPRLGVAVADLGIDTAGDSTGPVGAAEAGRGGRAEESRRRACRRPAAAARSTRTTTARSPRSSSGSATSCTCWSMSSTRWPWPTTSPTPRSATTRRCRPWSSRPRPTCPTDRIETLAYDKAADDDKVHRELLRGKGIKPVIQMRGLVADGAGAGAAGPRRLVERGLRRSSGRSSATTR